MSNIATKTITKKKQRMFIILFDAIVTEKGSKNKAAKFIGVNPETISRWENDKFMTLQTAERILLAYNKEFCKGSQAS
tara:strand:- start:270 stop:503 length:234 start_codon:yes stop_codon:yes gene_type:complete